MELKDIDKKDVFKSFSLTEEQLKDIFHPCTCSHNHLTGEKIKGKYCPEHSFKFKGGVINPYES